MKHSLLVNISVAAVAAVVLAGCGSSATYVDPASRNMVVSLNKVNLQDFNKASDKMVNSLIDNVINQNKLQSADNGPALVAISLIGNRTTTQLDTDLLTKSMRVALSRTDRVKTFLNYNLGNAEDPIARQQMERQNLINGAKTVRLPDYTLSGKIIEDRSSAGSTKQTCYIFQLSLTPASGIATWEEQETICKQGSRDKVGF